MSTGFTAVNENGSYFAEQIARNQLDPFAVFGLHADDGALSMRGARVHYRKVVMPHVFERGQQPAASSGPRVPTWAQVNQAKDMLLGGSKGSFEALKTAWSAKSVQVWNPFAIAGSPRVQLARTDRTVPAEYHAPDVEEVEDEAFRGATGPSGSGSQNNPFFFDDSEEEDAGAASSPPRPTTPPTPPSAPSYAPGSSRNPAAGTPQRVKPRGILLGTWAKSGLHAGGSNAVYGSRDKQDRINRRIAKVDVAGGVVLGGNFDVKRTACKHEDIDYVPKYQGMTKQEVDSLIMPLLRAADNEAQERARSASPSAAAAGRRRGQGGQGAGTASRGIQVRGASLFVDEDGIVHQLG